MSDLPIITTHATAAEITTESDFDNLQVDKTPEDKRKVAVLVEHPRTAAYTNNLTPPIDTSYWRLQSFSVMTKQDIFLPRASLPLASTLTWRIDAFIYVVNARPDADFSKNGGRVYVVLVHGGAAMTGGVRSSILQYRNTVSLRKPAGSAIRQLPQSNSGVEDGNTWKHPISFAQSMQMFRNNGQETFEFPARYEDSVNLRGHQTGFLPTGSSVHWAVELDIAIRFYTGFPFTALSIFQFESLEEVTFDCKASVYSPGGRNYPSAEGSEIRSITIDCRFSA